MNILKKFNYTRPVLKEFNYNNTQIKLTNASFMLLENNIRWNVYDTKTDREAYELYSHYHFAHGHCICTGLGFGALPYWLLQNPNVTKVTVIERNPNVIEYHKRVQPHLLNQIEIICDDVFNIKSKCDTLLIDHHEGPLELFESDFLDSAKLVSKNIKNKTMWFFPFENILNRYSKNKFLNLTNMEVFEKIKKTYKLNTLPNVDEDTLNHLVEVFFIRTTKAK